MVSPPLVSRRAAPYVCVCALIYSRDHRVLVGRDIIVSRPAYSVIASRHGSPLVVHLKSAGFCFFRAHIFAGLCRLVCARRRVRRSRDFLGWEVLGAVMAHHPALHFFNPGPNNKTG